MASVETLGTRAGSADERPVADEAEAPLSAVEDAEAAALLQAQVARLTDLVESTSSNTMPGVVDP